MTRAQRIVLILYLLSLAYCCLWIPWRSRCEVFDWRYQRVGYGWVWAGPDRYRAMPQFPTPLPYNSHQVDAPDPEILWLELKKEAVPDFPLIGIQLLAVTALWAAAFLIAGIKK